MCWYLRNLWASPRQGPVAWAVPLSCREAVGCSKGVTVPSPRWPQHPVQPITNAAGAPSINHHSRVVLVALPTLHLHIFFPPYLLLICCCCYLRLSIYSKAAIELYATSSVRLQF